MAKIPFHPTLKQVSLTIKNCKECPHCDTKRTEGAGYAEDYYCKKTPSHRVIAGYVEWEREGPQDGKIPGWCPLR